MRFTIEDTLAKPKHTKQEVRIWKPAQAGKKPGDGACTDTQICHCANYAHYGDDLMKNGQVFPLHAFTPFKKHHTQAKKERKYFSTAEESCQRCGKVLNKV